MSGLHPAVAFEDEVDGGAVDLGDDGSVDLGFTHAEGKRSEDEEETMFDTIVGVLQSALLRIRPEVESFCLAHCEVFEAAAENKLQYMDVYTRYSRMIEEHLESSLAAALPGTSLGEVERLLASRPEEVPDDVFDVLISDFAEFKDLMLSYKEQKAGEAGGGGADEARHGAGAEDEADFALRGAPAAAAAGGARSAGLPPLAAAGRSTLSLSLAGLSISGSSLSPHKSSAAAAAAAVAGGAGARSGAHKGLGAGASSSAGGYGALPPPSPILAEPAGFFASSR